MRFSAARLLNTLEILKEGERIAGIEWLTIESCSNKQLEGILKLFIKKKLASSIRELDISWNKLTVLPPEIGRLTALFTLDVHANKLKSLPPEIGQLKTLKKLVVRWCNLASLPREIGQLKTLQWLDAKNNNLASLPTEIGQLKVLEKLEVSRNRNLTGPKTIKQLRDKWEQLLILKQKQIKK